jgi:hypothetical protein
MDWQHWFEVILGALGVFFLYDFRQMQKDLKSIGESLIEMKGDLKVMRVVSTSHEKRLEKVENGAVRHHHE